MKIIGISLVAVAAACAEGVELANIKSTFALTRLLAIVVLRLLSPCAICGSYSTFKPASSIAFLKPSVAAFNDGCSKICVIPILYVLSSAFPLSLALFVSFPFDSVELDHHYHKQQVVILIQRVGMKAF